MSYPGRAPLVPYGLPPSMVPVPMPTHVVVGVGGRAPLLPAPPGKAPPRAPPKDEGPAVTVFIGNITGRAPDAMIRQMLSACGPVLSWKRVATFGFCEFGSPEAALRCVRLLHERVLADKRLVAKVDGKTQQAVDRYKSEQRDRLSEDSAAAGGTPPRAGEYLDARQRQLDEATARHLDQILIDYQHEINNYELLQKEEQMEKTNRALDDADIEEEKRDVIHREIGKFRESMKVREEW